LSWHGEELVTLSEAKIRLHELAKSVTEQTFLLLRHGKPVAALLGIERYQSLLSRIEDLEDQLAVIESRDEPSDMKVPWEKVKAESGLL
jgi:prevent-host-death family protein